MPRCLLLALALVVSLPARAADQQPVGVSGKRAMRHVEALVSYGERWPGSDGHRRAQNYIIRELRAYTEVEEVNFDVNTPRGAVAMKNIIGKIPGRSSSVVVLAGHYDTLRKPGFVGANDGGSSAALLLELARVLGRSQPNPLEVWVVFFDGEEAFVQWSPTDGTFGSRFQAGAWERDDTLKRIQALLLVDMIGDRELLVRRDTNSTPWLARMVWQAARDLGLGAHFTTEPLAVEDDHVPFLQRGVAAVDLIDFEYGPENRYWHTTEDTVDKVSPQSLGIVGRVVLETLSRLAPQPWPGEPIPLAKPR
jgi:Zn-dependent M28 family amino/carboxypeptidase